MAPSRRHAGFFLTMLCFAFGAGCAEPTCPVGTFKIGNFCRKYTDGSTAIDEVVGEGLQDGGTYGVSDAAHEGPAADGSAQLMDAASIGVADSATTNDATSAPTADSATPPCSATNSCQPAPECDAARACSPGYVCTNSKCVSACEQTKCDANASCSLVAGAASCACNAGFIQVPASGSTPARCAADVACAALGCHANASCELQADQLRHCVCKPGYTGSGTSCTPVMCDALPNPANGSVSTAGGRAFEQWAEYSCGSGYTLSGGATRRQCQIDRTWSGTAPTCVLACQATNDCGPGVACVENQDCGSGNTCEGKVCLLGSCAGGAITSAAQVSALRYCKQINGDLSVTLTASGPAQLEFPNLAIASGGISITADGAIASSRTLSFPTLTRVGGSLRLEGFALGPSGSGVVEASFPRLARIDLGLLALTAQSLRVLDLSSLTTVGGGVFLENLDYLQTLKLGALNSVGMELIVLRVPNVGYTPTFSRLAALFGAPKFGAAMVGCCSASNNTGDCDGANVSTCW